MDLKGFARSESKFLTIQDLGYDDNPGRAERGFDLTIVKAQETDAEYDYKPLFFFDGKKKGLLANKTNVRIMMKMREDAKTEQDMVGLELNLYVDPTVQNTHGEVVGGLRVRPVYKPDPEASDEEIPF